MTETLQQTSWSIYRKVGFRFLFIYFGLFIPFQNASFPFWSTIFEYPMAWMQELIVWLGANVYGLKDPISIQITGSGDTTYDYVFVLTALLFAILGALIWSVLDRKRPHYKTLFYWLTVAVRYYVAFMLIYYGLVKVIQLQFPAPQPNRLIETFGDSSPMGLAWTFLGFSKGYNMFMGIAELLAGLMFFRRTTTLGAIITLMTVMNVMALNYFYDIPVKIVSTHLVLMMLFLLAKDIRRLALFFFSNTPTSLRLDKRPIANRKIDIAINSLKILLIGYFVISGVYDCLEMEKQFGSKAPRPELYGVYDIEYCTVNGDTLTHYKDPRLWRTVAVSKNGSFSIQRMADNQSSFFQLREHESDVLTNLSDPKESFVFDYTKYDGGFEFQYEWKGDTICGRMKKRAKKDIKLINRKFHWISERPYNR